MREQVVVWNQHGRVRMLPKSSGPTKVAGNLDEAPSELFVDC